MASRGTVTRILNISDPILIPSFFSRPPLRIGLITNIMTILPTGEMLYGTEKGDEVARMVSQSFPVNRAVVYTTPLNTETVIRGFDYTNKTTGDVTINVWLAGMKLEHDLIVPAGASMERRGVWVLLAGETIELQASATGVDCMSSGVETTLVA